MQSLRLTPHNALTRATQIKGKPGIEAQVTVKSIGCRHGKCTFCGLGKMDAGFKNPLTRKEFLWQLNWAKEQVEDKLPLIKKVSILTNSHSTFEPDVIRRPALVEGARFILSRFPSLSQLSLESRINTVSRHDISKITRAFGYPPLDFMELAVGVESGIESARRDMKKGLSDLRIYEAARTLGEMGWAMRAYFIYNCPGRPFEARTEDFIRMAEFLSELKAATGVSLTLYANRGYVPEELAARFRDFRIANERETISDIAKAAEICRQGGIALDADVTGSDEALTSASALEIKSDFAQTISGFNMTQETSGLLKWLQANGF